MLSVPFVRYDSYNAYVIGNTNQNKIHFYQEPNPVFREVEEIERNYAVCFWFLEARDNSRQIEMVLVRTIEGDQFSSILESYTRNASRGNNVRLQLVFRR
jgi:hypothetical protein